MPPKLKINPIIGQKCMVIENQREASATIIDMTKTGKLLRVQMDSTLCNIAIRNMRGEVLDFLRTPSMQYRMRGRSACSLSFGEAPSPAFAKTSPPDVPIYEAAPAAATSHAQIRLVPLPPKTSDGGISKLPNGGLYDDDDVPLPKMFARG